MVTILSLYCCALLVSCAWWCSVSEGKPDGFASDLTVGEDGMSLAG